MATILMDGNTWYTYLIYSIIVVVAFTGNSVVLFVFFTRCTYLKQASKMLICNLACTDIITSIALIFSRYLYLPQMPSGNPWKDIYCKTIWSPWFLFTLGYVSIYTCLALAIERWLAIVKPLTYRLIKPKQTAIAIALVWIAGILVNISTLFRTKFDNKQCAWTRLSIGNDQLPWINFMLQSVIPFSLIVILYSHILFTLRRSSKENTTLPAHPLKRITLMTLAASSALVIGWLPSRISFMLSKFGYVDPNGVFHFCLVMFSFSNSCVNPFIYSAYSRQFRKASRDVLISILLVCKRQRSSASVRSNVESKNNVALERVHDTNNG